MSDSKRKDSGSTRTLRIEAISRIEGEGGLVLAMRDGQVEDVQLKIFEPPRFFEAFLVGRDFKEVPDITARICGICPIAYQMGACHALEKALGVFDQVEPAIRALRNIIYCGEWIESHVLHIFMLHLPDFLGYESALSAWPRTTGRSSSVRCGSRRRATTWSRSWAAAPCIRWASAWAGSKAPDPAAAVALAAELTCAWTTCAADPALGQSVKFPSCSAITSSLPFARTTNIP